MKKSSFSKTIFLLGSMLFALSTANFARSTLHIIKVKKLKDTYEFFRYTGKDIPVVSGRRGGIVKGFPENFIDSIEVDDAVKSFMPA